VQAPLIDCAAVAGRVRHHREGPIGWIVFDHPERHNAISAAMWGELAGAARAHAEDPEVRVIALRGAGERAFVSGADISEFEERGAPTPPRTASGRSASALRFDRIDKPVIAMIHGVCFGGGVGIAVAADLRYAADDASFCIPAARLGVAYPIAGHEALAQLVGRANALEIFFTAKRFGASEAHAMGLVNAVIPKPSLEARVREIAREIAANAPLSLRAAKCTARELARPAAERDLANLDALAAACAASDDLREGTRAFLEKRAPHFRGC
jgi:enoyl-CoA hydratase/carnithine racemase